MTDARNARATPDPLRSARRAVHAGKFRQAWDELQRARSVQETAEWLLLAAMASWRLGEYERSRTAALQARDRYRTVGDLDGAMRAENVAAAGAFAMGELEDAARGFTRALTLADSRQDDFMAARCANNLGNVEYYQARYVSALGFYRLAIAAFEKVQAVGGLAEAWLNTAIVSREHGDLPASRGAADRATAYADRAGDARIFGQALAASAETAAVAGDIALARVQVKRALEIARTHDDVLAEADALRINALLCLWNAEHKRAEDLGNQALRTAERVKHPWAVAEVERALGEIYEASGKLPLAARAFDAAAAAYHRMGAPDRASLMSQRSQSLES